MIACMPPTCGAGPHLPCSSDSTLCQPFRRKHVGHMQADDLQRESKRCDDRFADVQKSLQNFQSEQEVRLPVPSTEHRQGLQHSYVLDNVFRPVQDCLKLSRTGIPVCKGYSRLVGENESTAVCA